MLSLSANHPDIELFIDKKNDLNAVTKANISVRIDDAFMEKVVGINPNPTHICSFTREETNETTTVELNAVALFKKLCKNNWDMAEPGILFWDNIEKYHLMSKDETFEYAGVNPCAK